MLSPDLVKKLTFLSDTVLYPEAVKFIHRMVEQEECNPLPTSQVQGLLSASRSEHYGELQRYILHQRDRDWQAKKKDLKTFYTELEKYLTHLQNRRLGPEFQLSAEGLAKKELDQQRQELMAFIAADFLQHLVAENGMLQLSNPRSGR